MNRAYPGGRCVSSDSLPWQGAGGAARVMITPVELTIVGAGAIGGLIRGPPWRGPGPPRPVGPARAPPGGRPGGAGAGAGHPPLAAPGPPGAPPGGGGGPPPPP